MSIELATVSLTILLLGALLAISILDLRTFRIPNEMIAVLLIASVPAIFLLQDGVLGWRVAGALVCFLVGVSLSFGAEQFYGKTALGMGDVKLFSVASLWLGLANMPAVLVLASSTALAGAWFSGSTSGKPIAFGPYLCFAIAVLWFWTLWAI